VIFSPVLAAVRDPDASGSWSAPDWEILIRQARAANLLSRLASLIADSGLLDDVPAGPRGHLVAASVVARAQAEAVRREVQQVTRALAQLDVDVILLKGAAYLLGDLPPARGRVFSDVDILVPRQDLAEVEGALMLHGWAGSHHHPYDQRYYRQWMHELPPLRHVARQSVLDVHHAIVPLTARFKPDAASLIAAAKPVPGHPRLKVLAPEDMVIHAAAHLFLNEELSHGLRDLVDLDALLRHFGRTEGFWTRLCSRAAALDLLIPLQYALRYASRLLETPVPAEVSEQLALPRLKAKLFDALYLRALQPDHPGASDCLTPLARRLLYLRAHWLRLPPALLAYHIAVKAFRRHGEEAMAQPR
jgi:hypothetical protein